MNEFTVLFVVALFLDVVLEWWLAQRQMAFVSARRDLVPGAFSEKVKAEEHAKAAAYTLTKTGFRQKLLLFEMALLLLWTLGGLLNAMDQAWRGLEWSPLWTSVAFLASVMVLSAVLELPAAVYQTFVIEARFGFNRTTAKVFIVDLLRSAALFLIFGMPLITLVLWLMENAGSEWWLSVWAVWIGVNLIALWAYPAFIAPLYNKFKPLENARLCERIDRLLQRNGFSSQGIFVMDGSKRSSHGNAYFTGLGANKRIVFYDTLVSSLSESEVEAVLAHEVGHFKRKHVQKRIALMAALSLGGLALLGWLMQQAWFYNGLGMEQASTHAALVLFLFVIPPMVSVFFQPFLAWSSRRREFEADEFAAAQTSAAALSQALVKLYKENAATLTPDPLYSAFYDSHPPAPVRVAHLAAKGE
ncbi:MAG: M48 family metallopeptidase [Gammaproteobacteria bacterium]|nr:M48 family metallopeptidase [Gammaproteobacteria bacterium]